MRSQEYSRIRRHVHDHAAYLELLRRMRDRTASKSAATMATLLGFSISWFAFHITTDDWALVRFLVGRGELLAD